MEQDEESQVRQVVGRSGAAAPGGWPRRERIIPNPKLKLLDQMREVMREVMRLRHYVRGALRSMLS